MFPFQLFKIDSPRRSITASVEDLAIVRGEQCIFENLQSDEMGLFMVLQMSFGEVKAGFIVKERLEFGDHLTYLLKPDAATLSRWPAFKDYKMTLTAKYH